MQNGERATMNDPLLLRIRDAAEQLAISTGALYRLIAGGHIEAVHIGRATRIPRAELEAYVARLVNLERQ